MQQKGSSFRTIHCLASGHKDLAQGLVKDQEQGKLTVIEAEYQLDTGEVVRLDKAAQ
jgi:hypothetical protein